MALNQVTLVDPVVFPLSVQDQVAPRGHVRFILCFPFVGTDLTRYLAVERLQLGLDDVLSHWPHLRGNVKEVDSDPTGALHAGRIALNLSQTTQSANRRPIVTVRHHDSVSFLHTYRELKQAGFPSCWIDGPALASVTHPPSESENPPALSVQANFIHGGLLISLYLHHSVADGRAMDSMIKMFAAKTCKRRPMYHFSSPRANTPTPDRYPPHVGIDKAMRPRASQTNRDSPHEEESSGEFPEYCLLPTPSGPGGSPAVSFDDATLFATLGKATGRTFVMRKDRLTELRNLVNTLLASDDDPTRFVSTNDCVGALIWVHTTKARSSLPQLQDPLALSKFMIIVDNRQILRPPLSGDYFGNAVSLSATCLPVGTVLEASTAHESPSGRLTFAQVALAVRKAVTVVDDSFVRKRLELFDTIPDMRRLGYNINLELDVIYNTWAPFGADACWDIPGVPGGPDADDGDGDNGGAAPDAIRRGHHSWSVGGSTVLPRRRQAEAWEVIVELRQEAMNELLRDAGFMQWVDGVRE